MKLDLLARFPELQTFVKPRSVNVDARGRLGEFASIVRQSVEKTEETKSDSDPIVQPRFEILPLQTKEGKLDFAVPDVETSLPELHVLLPKQDSDDLMGESVKPPTLLEAKRTEAVEWGRGDTFPHSHLRMEEVQRLVDVKVRSTQVEPALALGVISAESSFNPDAVSTDGYETKGLFQLLDSTGQQWMKQRFPDRSYDPFDPELNIDLGISHLDYLHSIFKSETPLTSSAKTYPVEDPSSLRQIVVAAFNAGEGRVASAQKRAARAGRNPSEYDDISPYLPETTRTYVSRVFQFQKQFSAVVENNAPEKIG